MVITEEGSSIVTSEVLEHSFLKKIIPYYLFFGVINFIVDVVLISIVAFFHFVLGHEINEIEEWLSINSWEILIMSKMISFYLTTLSLDSRIYIDRPFKKFVTEYGRWPGRPLVIAIIGIWVFILTYGEWEMNSPVLRTRYNLFISYVGSALFYLFDYMILGYLCSVFRDFKRRERLFSLLFFPVLFYVFTVSKIAYMQNVDALVFVHFFTIFIFRYNNLKRWVGGLVYILTVAAPMSVIFSHDPLWGDAASFYQLQNALLVYSVIFPVVWGYLFYSMRKRHLAAF